MDGNGIESSCLSPDDHDHIRDPILHFLGCLEFCDRNAYFDTMTQDMQSKLVKHLRRINFLRHALSRDESSEQLIFNLHGSLTAWRCSASYQSGMMRVKAWRERHHLPIGWAQCPQELDEAVCRADYDLDRDTKAFHIKYEKCSSRDDCKDRKFGGRLSYNEISLNRILDEDDTYDPLKSSYHRTTEGCRDTNTNTINYFHIPANNMIVSLWSKPMRDNASTS